MTEKFQILFGSLSISFDPDHEDFEDEWLTLCETMKQLQLKKAEKIEA